MEEKKGLAEVPGILCGTAKCGIKRSQKPLERPDLLLVVTKEPAEFAAVYTTNDVKAAPVKVSAEIEGKVSGIVANSGNANACTGEQGISDALEMSKLASQLTGKGRFLVASTGVIGEPLPMERVRKGIGEAVAVFVLYCSCSTYRAPWGECQVSVAVGDLASGIPT